MRFRDGWCSHCQARAAIEGHTQECPRRLEGNNLDALRLLCSQRDVGTLARSTAEIRLRVFASIGRYVEGVRR
jgi:hypothetical protein